MLYPSASDLVTPSYNSQLAVVAHLVGGEGDEGRQSCDARADIVLDDDGSQQYVLLPDESGQWKAFDAFGQANGSDISGITVYHLDAARPIIEKEEVVFIRSLVGAFDKALLAQSKQAVLGETGYISHDSF